MNNVNDNNGINKLEQTSPKITEKTKRKKNMVIVLAVAMVIVVLLCFISSIKVKETIVDNPAKDVQQVDNYSDIYNIMKKIKNNNKKYDTLIMKNYNATDIAEKPTAGGNAVNTSPQTNMGASGTSSDTSGKTIDFSGTNIQVEGVQEADVIKCDGNYIYTLSNNTVFIVSVDKGQMRCVSKIEQTHQLTDMYILANTLVTLSSGHEKANPEKNIKTYIDIFDVSDKASPKHKTTLSQDGNKISSRMIGRMLYTITDYGVCEDINNDEPTTFIPTICDSEEKCIDLDDIYIMPNPARANYTVVTSVDVNNCNKFKSSKTVFGEGINIYSSVKNLYLVAYNRFNGDGKSNIVKFTYNDGEIIHAVDSAVDGNVLNQFSMDEYNENFRIVTTSKNGNSLYIMNNKLEQIGKIEDVAKGEQVYSVRFNGDIAYFVTFRRTDPLFTVDVSNPKAPKILSELKIPGFSEYMHPYSENLLLGFGNDADPKTGRRGNLKLSMFDVKDKTNVTEKYKTLIPEAFYSEASQNHKAILISAPKNIIAFAIDNAYVIYSFNETDGFKEMKRINIENSFNARGIYIEDVLYLMSDDSIASYSMKEYEIINSISLDL